MYAHAGVLYLPAPFSSMIFWALVFAADIVAGDDALVKKLRRKEMVGDVLRRALVAIWRLLLCVCVGSRR